MILKKMPFLRSRHDGTLVSPETLDSSSRSVKRSLIVARSIAICGALSLSTVPSAIAAPKKVVGVRAWTSGSTTTIRARPSVDTPIVAKVPRHMQVFVWGKYNGWYRVETHDHMFGWVHNPYISSPDIHKVAAMSGPKAKDASKRTDKQVVFGTVDQLKKFYIQTGADGARKGLALKGVFIDSPRDIMPTRSASAPKHARQHVAVAAKLPSVVSVAAPRAADPIPVSEPAIAASGEQTSRLLTLRQNVLSSVPSNSVPQKVTVAVPPRVVAVRMAPVKSAPAPRPVARIAAAPAHKTAAKPMTWRQKRWSAKAAAKKNQREVLRTRVGLAPKPIAPAPIASLPTISPEQLVEARNAYLQARQQRQAATITPVSPVTNVSPVPEPQLGGQIEPAAPARITPSSFDSSVESSHNLLLIEESGDKLVLKQSVGSTPLLLTTVVSNAKLKPATQAPALNRGGSPRDRARMNLGNGIANQALSYRGMRYVYGSANPRRGFDCSGLIYFMLRQRGYNPPRTAAGYKNYGTSVARGQWQKGDLILFANTYKRGISHIGVYLGNNNFVHAATSGSGVRVDSLNAAYYSKKYYSARRVK